ncbi:MAG TPA: TIGR03621 family F420-dependent LLM class oxidoreductase [Acidimicrobiia bacterium]|nr:TIGR03621 family F420-dependent LLM class oxidoreductase [Acidimicrobiia bacterium]
MAGARREFEFGLQVANAGSRAEWQETARRAEGAGFDSILIGDHVVDGILSPMVALDAMAEVTTTLRVGTCMLNNDFRHPALLAREAATLDLLSDGRLELGIGAGHAAPEYAEIGLPFDPAARRVDRLEESVVILRRLFDGETVSCAGEHYQLREHRLFPLRRPLLTVGGNGDRVLRIAARHADAVGITGLGRTRADGQFHDLEWRHDEIDAKVDVIRAGAGERADTLRIQALVQHVQLTDDRAGVVEAMARRLGNDPAVMLDAPYLWVGGVTEIVERARAARDRWGFDYFVTRSLDASTPIIAALR